MLQQQSLVWSWVVVSLDDAIICFNITTDWLLVHLLKYHVFQILLLFDLFFYFRVQQLVELMNFFIGFIMFNKVGAWAQRECLWIDFFAIVKVWIL
jgi:hypothetical protein